MHIKFLARGTGSARAAANYLLGARDAAGQPREGVEVLRGDPHQVAAVADAQIGAVIDAFERTGLSPAATPGRQWCIASATAALTCMPSPCGATWRPGGGSLEAGEVTAKNYTCEVRGRVLFC